MNIRFLLLLAAVSSQGLTLREAEQIALRENPQVMGSRLAALATERGLSAGPAWMPRIDFLMSAIQAPDPTRVGAQPGAITNPAIIPHFAFGMHLTMPVTDFGRSAMMRDAARERSLAQKEQSRLIRAQVLLAVRTAYWGLWRAQELERLAASSELESTLARNNRLIAAMELATLLGRRPTEPMEAEDAPDLKLEVYDIEELIARALDSSPALEERRHLSTAASKTASAERRAVLPVISFIGSAGLVPVAAARYPGDSYSAGGFLVSVPVLPRQPVTGRREEAELLREAALASMRGVEDRIAKDVAAEVVRINSASASLALARRNLDEAKTPAERSQATARLIAAEHEIALRKAALAFHVGEAEPR
jgi:outer membrane protein TolC